MEDEQLGFDITPASLPKGALLNITSKPAKASPPVRPSKAVQEYTSGGPPRPEEFFHGFAWAMPTAFATSLGHCRFEQGDVFHDSTKGYEQWDTALQHISFTIQVVSPPHSTTKVSENQNAFRHNWKLPVVYKVLDHKENKTRQATSTQGKLFTFLWRGDWKVLSSTPHPEIPLTCYDKKLTQQVDKAAGVAERRFATKLERGSIFVMAYDPTHPVSSAKYEAIKQALTSRHSFEVALLMPMDAGLTDMLVAPTVRFATFIIQGNSWKIHDTLKDVLYKPAKFRIEAHGSFLRFDDP